MKMEISRGFGINAGNCASKEACENMTGIDPAAIPSNKALRVGESPQGQRKNVARV